MKRSRATFAVAILSANMSGCEMPAARAPIVPDSEVLPAQFPESNRTSAPILSSRWSTEEARDKAREADTVMDIAGTNSGMTVADIGAGEGYYTVRLAAKVGEEGRVVAQDVVPEVRDRLADRVTREVLDNVSVKLGGPADPKLPPNSFDRVFMMHMYHEIGAPYEFLWRLRPSLAPKGRVVCGTTRGGAIDTTLRDTNRFFASVVSSPRIVRAKWRSARWKPPIPKARSARRLQMNRASNGIAALL